MKNWIKQEIILGIVFGGDNWLDFSQPLIILFIVTIWVLLVRLFDGWLWLYQHTFIRQFDIFYLLFLLLLNLHFQVFFILFYFLLFLINHFFIIQHSIFFWIFINLIITFLFWIFLYFFCLHGFCRHSNLCWTFLTFSLPTMHFRTSI